MSARILLPVVTLSWVFGCSLAAAQSTTLKLTTSQQKSCVAVTDGQGVRMEEGGSALVATGVQLSGEGCGTQQGSFGATVSVPSTATAGQDFTVTWSANEAATRCVYAGSPGATGWTVGSTACQGSACAGSHNVTVRVPTAGSHVFAMACTNDQGYAQGSTTLSPPLTVPQPPNFALTATPSGDGYGIGKPFTVAWSVTGAASCTGTATLGGSAETLPGWTDTTGAASPRTVTPAKAGNWVLKLACTNSVGTTNSQDLAITIPGGEGTACPAGRQEAVKVCYNANLSTCVDLSGNMTFDQVWGRINPGDPLQPFPALARLLTFKDFDKTKYLAIEIPAAQMPSLLQQGKFTHGETNSGPLLTMKLSTACGDFEPTTDFCSYEGVGGGARLGTYALPGSPAWGCRIESNQRYFINIKATNPTAAPPRPTDCSGNVCKVAIQHTPPSS